MNGDISNFKDYSDGIEKFLSNETNSLNVILDDMPNESSKVLDLLIEKSKNRPNVKLKIANENFKNSLKNIQVDPNAKLHFTIGDNTMIRIENDEITHEAEFCSFNYPIVASKLANIFDNSFDSCVDFEKMK